MYLYIYILYIYYYIYIIYIIYANKPMRVEISSNDKCYLLRIRIGI